jgi:hypothetical protein
VFSTLQNGIVLLISLAAFVSAVWALVEALRYPNEAYTSAGKQSKALWGAILGGAAAIAFISLPYPFGRGSGIVGFLGIAALVAVIYFFVDVKPKLGDRHRPGPRGGRSSSGGW